VFSVIVSACEDFDRLVTVCYRRCPILNSFHMDYLCRMNEVR